MRSLLPFGTVFIALVAVSCAVPVSVPPSNNSPSSPGPSVTSTPARPRGMTPPLVVLVPAPNSPSAPKAPVSSPSSPPVEEVSTLPAPTHSTIDAPPTRPPASASEPPASATPPVPSHCPPPPSPSPSETVSPTTTLDTTPTPWSAGRCANTREDCPVKETEKARKQAREPGEHLRTTAPTRTPLRPRATQMPLEGK
jgi:hypothetical protein